MTKVQTRRQFIFNAGYAATGLVLLGCGSGGSDDTSTDSGTTSNQAPSWSTIPAQAWIVGVPVYIDLMDYVSDPDGDTLTFVLDQPLPDGVTLNGSVISGTPTTVTPSANYVASADDGNS